MICILSIESSTDVCSVAISVDGNLVFEREELNGPSHATILGVFLLDAIQFVKNNDYKLNAVAISSGPGSYTGLRIGVSEAKGLCYGFDIPLIAIDTLKVMTVGLLKKKHDLDMLYCPMIDARRMEVYDAIYDVNLNEVKTVTADIIDVSSFSDLLDDHRILFFGNGCQKCKSVLTSKNVIFQENIYPKAADVLMLAEQKYKNKDFVDVAYFEPFYLKDFVATVAKNKVLDNK